jgi:FKBP-type peptidyl-prolyl cis-trans isomerase 2
MSGRNWERNQANDLKDHFGRELVVGQLVCKPTISGRSAIPEIRRVILIKEGKVYLDGNHKLTPINYSGRLVILANPNAETFTPTEL